MTMRSGSPKVEVANRISVAEFNRLMAQSTPLAGYLGIRAESISDGEARSRLVYSPTALRPGGTHSGPALMALVDMCMYAAVLGKIGNDPRPLTTSLDMHFLRRAPASDLIAHCTLLSCGRMLAVGSIAVSPDGDEDEIVCMSTCTYALPPTASQPQNLAP